MNLTPFERGQILSAAFGGLQGDPCGDSPPGHSFLVFHSLQGTAFAFFSLKVKFKRVFLCCHLNTPLWESQSMFVEEMRECHRCLFRIENPVV